ncbi:MAG: FtsX-like permease family protein [Marivibrio sp.]|uniref:cell division protein FtsX n=1 Tax=Marivibrio sp. TaxID=2039719 RepID=UPI0032EBF88F
MSARGRAIIPFAQDPAGRLMPWLIGFMTFVAGLALAGALLLHDFAESWSQGLADSMTVQIPPPADEMGDAVAAEARLDRAVEDAVRILADAPGIAAAEPLPGSRIQALLEPWLGETLDPASLPLPRLIAVEVADMQEVDLAVLRQQLQTVAPGAALDDHGLWRARLVAFLQSLQLVGLAVVAVVILAAATVVLFATRGGLLAHHETIELLHLIGASDNFIARQFQRQALRASLKGGLGGALIAGLTVIGLGYAAAATGAELPGPAVLDWPDWPYLALLPLATALLSHLAARRTVLRSLRRMP